MAYSKQEDSTDKYIYIGLVGSVVISALLWNRALHLLIFHANSYINNSALLSVLKTNISFFENNGTGTCIYFENNIGLVSLTL